MWGNVCNQCRKQNAFQEEFIGEVRALRESKNTEPTWSRSQIEKALERIEEKAQWITVGDSMQRLYVYTTDIQDTFRELLNNEIQQ
jgi:hypothetical protein